MSAPRTYEAMDWNAPSTECHRLSVPYVATSQSRWKVSASAAQTRNVPQDALYLRAAGPSSAPPSLLIFAALACWWRPLEGQSKPRLRDPLGRVRVGGERHGVDVDGRLRIAREVRLRRGATHVASGQLVCGFGSVSRSLCVVQAVICPEFLLSLLFPFAALPPNASTTNRMGTLGGTVLQRRRVVKALAAPPTR